MKDQIADIDEREIDRIEAIIYSMTPAERANPKILNGSRRARIAKGSGTHGLRRELPGQPVLRGPQDDAAASAGRRHARHAGRAGVRAVPSRRRRRRRATRGLRQPGQAHRRTGGEAAEPAAPASAFGRPQPTEAELAKAVGGLPAARRAAAAVQPEEHRTRAEPTALGQAERMATTRRPGLGEAVVLRPRPRHAPHAHGRRPGGASGCTCTASLLPGGEVTRPVGGRRACSRTEPVADAVTVCTRRLDHAGPGRRPLPRRARTPTAPSTRTIAEAQAITDRDAGTLLIRDAGSPVDTRWIDDRDGPAADHPGRTAHRPAAALHPQLRRRGRAGRSSSTRCARQAARGDGWVKLVGDWIDRDAGDLAPAVAGRRRRGGHRRAPTSWAPGSPPTASARSRCTELVRGRHRRHRARHRPGRRHDRADGRARRRARADADQPGELPGHRRRGRGQVPRLRRATCAPCTPAASRPSPQPSRPASRSTPAPTPAARIGPRPDRRRDRALARLGGAGVRARRGVLAGPGVAGRPAGRGRRLGRPGGLRHRPAPRPGGHRGTRAW